MAEGREFLPQDATRPLPADSGGGGARKGHTFDDMPEGRKANSAGMFGLKEIEFSDDADQPEESDEPTGAGAAAPPAAPAMQMPAQPAPASADEIAASMWRIEQARRAEDEARARQQFAQEQMSQTVTPPPLPEDIEGVLSDPNKFREFIAARDQHYIAAAQALATPGAMQSQEALRTIQQLNASVQALYQEGKARTWAEARDILNDAGIDADKYSAQLEYVFRSNPQQYWTMSRDVNTVVKGIQILHSEATGKPIEALGTAPAANRGFRSAARSAGRGNRSTAGAARFSASDEAALAKAEQVLGVKFDERDKREYLKTVSRR